MSALSPLHTADLRRSGSAASSASTHAVMTSPMHTHAAPAAAASAAAAAAAGSTDSPSVHQPHPAQPVPPINVNSMGAGRPGLRATRSTSRPDSSGEFVPVESPLFYSLLVHNLSHSDLMLGIRAPDGTVNVGTETQHAHAHAHAQAASEADGASDGASLCGTSVPPLPPSIVARPKFSRFKQVSSRLLAYVDGVGGGAGALQGIEFPSPLMAQRAQPTLKNQHSSGGGGAAAASSSSAAAAAAAASSWPSSVGKTTCPYGFRVKDGACKFADWTSFKLKGEDTGLAGGLAKALPKPEIIGVFFPMLAVLVPRWLTIVAAKNARRGILHDNQNKKILYLISGAGTPWNTEHDSSGNSTKGVAKLATIFLNQFYPDVEDANVQFVNKELKPRIELVRRVLADKYADKWSKFMHLATTLTDGASARISAINASLRHLRPDALHMWQLKSFWHEYPLISGTRESDVEYHEFDKLEMTPPTLVSDTDNWVRMLVKEMIAHKEEFERVRDEDRDRVPNELDSFWLRKSKQPVLSVLMVKKKNKGVKFFRGINVEVSMPTGSLCSERNAIGSALSSDPSLCRKDLRMIAVLALGLEPHSTTSSLRAGMPVPKELIPIAPTTAYGTHASPTRGTMSPKLGRYPTSANASHSHSPAHADVEVSIDTSAVDSAMLDTELPQSAGRPPLQRATSERSIFHRKNSNSGASGASSSGGAPPTSPALKGKSGPNLTVPGTSSPHVSPIVSPAKQPQPQPQPTPMLDDELTMAAPPSTTVTPRKRKAGAAASSTAAIAQPSPVGTGSVSFAAAVATAAHSPAMSPGSATPPIHSPRFGRNNTMPAQAATAAAAAASSVAPHAARDISSALSRSALAAPSSSSPAVSPLSPQRTMQTRANGISGSAAAAGEKDSTQPADEARDKKRAKRSPSVSGAAAAAAAAAAAVASLDASSSACGSCTPPSHASDSVYASGSVSASMQRAYLSHELSLVSHRDALHLAPSEVAKLSGNHAPNATNTGDTDEHEHMQAAAAAAASSGVGAPFLPSSSSLGSVSSGAVAASAAAASPVVLDERNPINPCGSCNEWLKKIAEVNPEFKVITFTATDCSTCFVKAVKF